MNDPQRLLVPSVCKRESIDAAAQLEMFALYARYFGGTGHERFAADLLGKDRVLMLRDEAGVLQGFSTLAVYERKFSGQSVRVLFSGDTVIDENYWGQQVFAFSWLRLAGEIKAEQPDTRLYWLLISKGHRTYRYLSAFSREYYPARGRDTPPEVASLMDFLARERFGGAYDARAGVLRFPESQGHLHAAYSQVPAAHQRLPEVRFFLENNPGYARGEELVCLCELAADNLKPIARRAFLGGATVCA
jgi:hypothetical protein